MSLFFLLHSHRQKESSIKQLSVPTLDVAKPSVSFILIKKEPDLIELRGNFTNQTSLYHFLELLPQTTLQQSIALNSELVLDEDVTLLLEKLTPLFIQNFHNGKIEYKNKKLLVEGVLMDRESYEKVDSLLTYSVVNSFNNTRTDIEASTVLSKLDALVVAEDEMIETLNVLKGVAEAHPLEEKRGQAVVEKNSLTVEKEIKAAKMEKKPITEKEKSVVTVVNSNEVVSKDNVVKNSELPISPIEKLEKEITATKGNIELPSIKQHEELLQESFVVETELSITIVEKKEGDLNVSALSEEEVYQRKLAESMPDSDIMALPSVETVDINIEEKIKRGEVKALTTNKPLVHQKMILLSEGQNTIDTRLPDANLYDKGDKLEGVVLEDVVASPEKVD